MTFYSNIKALMESPSWPAVIQLLRRYLIERGYHGLYKNIVPPASYIVTPSFFSYPFQNCHANNRPQLPGSGFPGCALGYCLTAHIPISAAELDEEERELACMLETVGILAFENNIFYPRRLQLLSIGNQYLFVDAAIHFPEKAVHEIYIGPDSHLLMHCMGDVALKQESCALDLCSGSGAIGLFMAKTHANVVSTDISPAALALIRLNTALNNAAEKITIREERLQETLSGAECFDLVACNPPFVAFPQGFNCPLYAAGSENDGLGYMRMLLEKVPDILNEGGEGYFVADMPGDGLGAHFFRELEMFAEKKECAIDAFVMNRTDARLQSKAMAGFLQQLHPDVNAEEIEVLTAQFILKELRASHYYLSIIKIKKGSKTGIRVLNQFAARRFDDYFARF